MTKNDWLKIINPILFISVLIQALTGLAIFFGWAESVIIYKLHAYNGLFFIAVAGLHLWLNWQWVKATFLKKVSG